MKQIEGFSKYFITEDGQVWSEKTKKFLKPRFDKDGYVRISLRNDEGKLKTRFIHRLVAEAYIPNPEGLATVNHKDEDKQNNCVDNLEWLSQKDNIRYGTGIVRSKAKRMKTVYCIELDEEMTTEEAAARFGVNANSICKAANGEIKTSCGKHWRYV